MSTVNPLHDLQDQPSRYYLTLPPGRQGIVFEKREDGQYYVDEFLEPSRFIAEGPGSQIQIGDILSTLNDISVVELSPRKLLRIFREDIPKHTCWIRSVPKEK